MVTPVANPLILLLLWYGDDDFDALDSTGVSCGDGNDERASLYCDA